MKIKNQLAVLVQASFILGGIGFSSLSHATACAVNASQTADCIDLTVNTSTSPVTNNYSVTSTGSVGFSVSGVGTVLSAFTNNGTINPGNTAGVGIQSNATVKNFNNIGTTMGHLTMLSI